MKLKSEYQMPNVERNPNAENRITMDSRIGESGFRALDFVILSSFVIRHSGFL